MPLEIAMYGPPPLPPRRSGVPVPGVAAVGVVCLLLGSLFGCVAGVGIGSAPPAEDRVAATSSTAPSTTATPSAEPTVTATPTPTIERDVPDPDPEPTRSRAKPRPKPKPTTARPKPPSTDPRFSTCRAANDAGFGPYTQGVDPEYAWYQDRDNDGRVCER
jgi:hypothetical protein